MELINVDDDNIQGWLLSNNESGDIVIQKDDEIERFKNDDEATIFVVQTYHALLKGCEQALNTLLDGGFPKSDQICQELTAIIKNAKGG